MRRRRNCRSEGRGKAWRKRPEGLRRAVWGKKGAVTKKAEAPSQRRNGRQSEAGRSQSPEKRRRKRRESRRARQRSSSWRRTAIERAGFSRKLAAVLPAPPRAALSILPFFAARRRNQSVEEEILSKRETISAPGLSRRGGGALLRAAPWEGKRPVVC